MTSLPKSSDSSSLKTSPGKPSSPVMKSPVRKPLKSSATVSSYPSAKNSTDDHLVRLTGDAMAGMEDPLTSVNKQKLPEAKRTETSSKSATEEQMPKTSTVKADQ